MGHPYCMGGDEGEGWSWAAEAGKSPQTILRLWSRPFILFCFSLHLIVTAAGHLLISEGTKPQKQKTSYLHFLKIFHRVLSHGKSLDRSLSYFQTIVPPFPGSWRMVPSEKTLSNFPGSWLAVIMSIPRALFEDHINISVWHQKDKALSESMQFNLHKRISLSDCSSPFGNTFFNDRQ